MISAAQAVWCWATAAQQGPMGHLGSAALGLAVAWRLLVQVPLRASAAAALPASPSPGATLQHPEG